MAESVCECLQALRSGTMEEVTKRGRRDVSYGQGCQGNIIGFLSAIIVTIATHDDLMSNRQI